MSSDRPVEARSWWARGLMPAAFIATLALQGSVVLGGYYLDSDDWFVVSMGHWTETMGLREGLTRFWTEEPTWRPALTFLSYCEWRIFGQEPMGRYCLNLGLHALAALLVYFWVRRRRPAAARLACLLYLAHPLHAEALAWFHSGFEGILVSVFGLATLLAQGAPQRRGFGLRQGAPRVVLMLLCLQLGLWSRESVAAVVPVVAALAFIEGERSGRWRRAVHDALPLAALVLVNVGWRFVMLELEPDRRALGTFNVVDSPLTALAAVVLHPWLPVHPGLPWRGIFWALTGLVSVLTMIFMARSRDGRCAFFMFLVLVIPFVPMFHEASRFFEAAGGGHEQRWYFFHLALAPLCIGAAVTLTDGGASSATWPAWVRRALGVLVSGVFVVTQFANATWWRDESDVARAMAETLRAAAVESPSSGLGIISSEGSDAVELADQVLLNFANLDPRVGRPYLRVKSSDGDVSKDVVVRPPLRVGGPSPIPTWRPWAGTSRAPDVLWFTVDEGRRALVPALASPLDRAGI